MNIGLVILAVFVLVIMAVGNVAETHAHKSPKAPLEDLRIAYAPDLLQVSRERERYQAELKHQIYLEEKRRQQEPWDRYKRELEDARIKRWIEGNPVTDENPLKKREQPIPPLPQHSRFIL